MKRIFTVLNIFCALLLASCAVQKPKPLPYQNIADILNNSPIISQHHVGFTIKELGSDKTMFQKNEDKYFTPASNTKLFTFYTALNLLGDSIPSIEYATRKDSLFIWPMADPTFLHPDFKNHKAFDFIKNSGKNIFLISGRFQGDRLGYGWNWNDYNDYYQTEMTDFPMYGNVVEIRANPLGKLEYSPDLPALYLNEIATSASVNKAKREVGSNNLTVPSKVAAGYSQTIPLHLSKNLTENLLSDTLLATGLVIKPVVTLPWRKVPVNIKTVYSVKADSLYKLMLQPSDNFMAEEILLNCAAANHITMRTDSVISLASKTFLKDLPDKIQWVDGSGLSRHNLFTPRDMVAVLQKIYDKVGNEERLFRLLPNGGKSGTLRNMFKSSSTPFVFAKSGSLSNNYNLSGYLIGASGKKYLFSFMNNSYMTSTATVRAEVDRILTFIHDNY